MYEVVNGFTRLYIVVHSCTRLYILFSLKLKLNTKITLIHPPTTRVLGSVGDYVDMNVYLRLKN